ncbi:hypothetical protein D3C76_1579730 [compost metagenome]
MSEQQGAYAHGDIRQLIGCKCQKETGQLNNEPIRLRPAVKWFAEQMELTLRRNDHKGGWQNCSLHYLHEKLDEEVSGLYQTQTDKETIKEATDVANIAMMIADNARWSLRENK